MNHFNKFCISPLCTIDHWVSGKVSAACNNIIKNTSLRIQMRTMSDESWWLGCSWPEGKEGLVLPPHSPPPPTTFEATMASPWSQHRPTKSRHGVLLGEHNIRVCFHFFQFWCFGILFLRRYCYTPVWALKNGRSGNVGPWVLKSLKEDKAWEGEKQEQDDKKKFFSFAIILDDRVSLIYEGNISSKFHLTCQKWRAPLPDRSSRCNEKPANFAQEKKELYVVWQRIFCPLLCFIIWILCEYSKKWVRPILS